MEAAGRWISLPHIEIIAASQPGARLPDFPGHFANSPSKFCTWVCCLPLTDSLRGSLIYIFRRVPSHQPNLALRWISCLCACPPSNPPPTLERFSSSLPVATQPLFWKSLRPHTSDSLATVLPCLIIPLLIGRGPSELGSRLSSSAKGHNPPLFRFTFDSHSAAVAAMKFGRK